MPQAADQGPLGPSVGVGELEADSVDTQAVQDGAITRAKTSGVIAAVDTNAFPHSTDSADYTLTPIAASASSPAAQYDQQELFTTNAGWTQVGTLVTVDDAGFPDILKAAAVDLTSHNRVHKALTTPLADTYFKAEFDFLLTSLATSRSSMLLAFTSTNGTMIAADTISIALIDTAGTKSIRVRSWDASVFNADSADITISTATRYYATFQRTSATTTTLKIYSDAARTTQVGATVTCTHAATITGLAYIQAGSYAAGNGGETATYELDNLTIQSAGHFAQQTIDGVATTYGATDSEATPYFKYTLSSSADKEVAGIALKIPAAINTVTTIRIYLSADDVTYTLNRTILVSALTAGQYDCIRLQRDIQQNKYLKVDSPDTGILAITDILVRAPTESQWNRRQAPVPISSTSTTTGLSGV